MRGPFPLLLASLLLSLPIANAVTLSNFQAIDGFSSQCTDAYNTELQGCSESDFTGGNSCSGTCIAFLDALTSIINTQCKGTSAEPTTLMGLFYIQQGTSTLCPDVLGEQTSSENVQNLNGDAQPEGASDTGGGTSEATATKTVVSVVPSVATVSPTSSSVFTITKSILTKTQTSTFISSTLTAVSSPSGTTTIVLPTTVTPDSNSGPAWPTDPSAYPTSSSSSSQPSPSSKNNGGGTILDIGSSAPPTARIPTRLLALLACLYFL